MRYLSPLLLLATPALADTPTEAEASFLPRLLDMECVDLDRSIDACERVFLLIHDGEDPGVDADLLILPHQTAEDQTPLASFRLIANNGGHHGSIPSLSLDETDRLWLNSEHTAIGRHPWYQNVLLSHDGGDYTIAAYYYAVFDRITGVGFDCEIDLQSSTVRSEILDGEGNVIASYPAALSSERWPLQDGFAYQGVPVECDEGMGAYWGRVWED